MGNEPALTGLVRVYKEYYPDVIVGEATAGRASHFAVCAFAGTATCYNSTANLPQHPNTEWREHLKVIHASNLSKSEALPETSSFKAVRRGVKRSRVSLVPEVQTSRADEVRSFVRAMAHKPDANTSVSLRSRSKRSRASKT